MAQFNDCHSIAEVGTISKGKGFTPGENALFGDVHPVHAGFADGSWTSGHYRIRRDGAELLGPLKLVSGKQTPQGVLAIDYNDNDVADDTMPFDNEHEALTWLYDKLFKVFGPKGYNVLDELFFDKRGWVKEDPTSHAHPQPGHETHLHVRFKVRTW